MKIRLTVAPAAAPMTGSTRAAARYRLNELDHDGRPFAENRRMCYLCGRQGKVRGQHEPDPVVAGFCGVVHLGAASQREHLLGLLLKY
jgi:hypothetical protein